MKLTNFSNIHLTGIKGVAMTSLALCLDDMGIELTGSDTDELFVTDEVLAKRQLSWQVGFSPRNISDLTELVIATGAHGGLNNPECLYAKKKGIPVITHAQALGLLSEGKTTIAVCGVGGKTTTSSMIAHLLSFSSKKPSFALGVGNVYPLGIPGRYEQDGEFFVCEADEFAVSPGLDNRPRFSFLKPTLLVVTNIEHDHPDIYPSLNDTIRVYKRFFKKIPKNGYLIANIDNEQVVKVIKDLGVSVVTYGFNSHADWQITDYLSQKERTDFILLNKKGEKYKVSLKVPGKYNVENATAAFIVGKLVGIDGPRVVSSLETFAGTRRRFERIGLTSRGAIVIDDYAHHPKEIKAVIKAARERFPQKRLVVVFQPHTYSRTKALFDDFAKSLSGADRLALMDIYSSAREKVDPEVSSAKLVREVKVFLKEVYYTCGHKETVRWLKKNLDQNDVLLTLGAGDVFYLHKNLLA